MVQVPWAVGLLVLLASAQANGEPAADQSRAGGVYLPRLGAQIELPAGWTYAESGETFDVLKREGGAAAVLFAAAEPEKSCADHFDGQEANVDLEVGHGFAPRVRKEVDGEESLVGFCRPLPGGQLFFLVVPGAPGAELVAEVASEPFQRALQLGAAVAGQLEHTPGWRVPKAVLELPGTGLTLQLPASPTQWELDETTPGMVRRVRPESPSLKFTASVLEKQPASPCDGFLRAAMEQMHGTVRPAPLALPADWHPVVGLAGRTMLVCREQTAMVSVGIFYEGDFDSEDLKELWALLEQIGLQAEQRAAERIELERSRPRESAPAVASQPASAEESAFSLGGIDFQYWGGVRSTGLKPGEGAFGGAVGTSGFLLDDSEALSFAGHFDVWLGYTPRDGTALEGAIKLGGGLTGRNRFALVALAGIGYSHLGAEPLPSGIIGLLEARGRLRFDAVAFEAAIGRNYDDAFEWRSNNFELRIYFALGESSTWTAAWRHANCPGLTQELFVLGRGF